jgi:ABC-type uncharacterized transport system substrate-binding protein
VDRCARLHCQEGIEYVELGKQTGRLAARCSGREKAGEIPFEIIADS